MRLACCAVALVASTAAAFTPRLVGPHRTAAHPCRDAAICAAWGREERRIRLRVPGSSALGWRRRQTPQRTLEHVQRERVGGVGGNTVVLGGAGITIGVVLACAMKPLGRRLPKYSSAPTTRFGADGALHQPSTRRKGQRLLDSLRANPAADIPPDAPAEAREAALALAIVEFAGGGGGGGGGIAGVEDLVRLRRQLAPFGSGRAMRLATTSLARSFPRASLELKEQAAGALLLLCSALLGGGVEAEEEAASVRLQFGFPAEMERSARLRDSAAGRIARAETRVALQRLLRREASAASTAPPTEFASALGEFSETLRRLPIILGVDARSLRSAATFEALPQLTLLLEAAIDTWTAAGAPRSDIGALGPAAGGGYPWYGSGDGYPGGSLGGVGRLGPSELADAAAEIALLCAAVGGDSAEPADGWRAIGSALPSAKLTTRARHAFYAAWLQSYASVTVARALDGSDDDAATGGRRGAWPAALRALLGVMPTTATDGARTALTEAMLRVWRHADADADRVVGALASAMGMSEKDVRAASDAASDALTGD